MNIKGTKKKNQVVTANIFEQQELLKKAEVIKEAEIITLWIFIILRAALTKAR